MTICLFQSHSLIFLLLILLYLFGISLEVCSPQIDVSNFNCSHQSLSGVPSGIHPETLTIDLTHGRIEVLHEDSFLGLRQLQKLYLGGNRIYKITDRAMDPIALTLEVLSLRNNRLSIRALSNFPRSALMKLKNLHTLDLSGNPLNEITPGWFSSMGEHLRTLHLANLVGQLAIYPDAFLGLGLVDDFDISGNQFSIFPENAFAGIRADQLQHINLRHIPWLCDCTLLWLGHWLSQIRVKKDKFNKPITTSCKQPEEFSSISLTELPMSVFQCPPKLQDLHTNAPYIRSHARKSMHVSAIMGETLQLNCTFISQPKMLVNWFRNGILLRPELKRFRQIVTKGSLFSTTLTIESLQQADDSGNYSCTSVNNRGSARGIFQVKVSNQQNRDSKFLGDQADAQENGFLANYGVTSLHGGGAAESSNSWMLLLALVVIAVCIGSGAILLFLLIYYKVWWPTARANRKKMVRKQLNGALNHHQENLTLCPDSNAPEICPIQSENISVANNYAIQLDAMSVASRRVSESNFLVNPVNVTTLTNKPVTAFTNAYPFTDPVSIVPCNSHLCNFQSKKQLLDGEKFPVISSENAQPSKKLNWPFEHATEELGSERRPIVRTFAPFESYENFDVEDSDSATNVCPVHDRLPSDENVSVDDICPVHGSKKQDIDDCADDGDSEDWCPVHSSEFMQEQAVQRTWSINSDSQQGFREMPQSIREASNKMKLLPSYSYSTEEISRHSGAQAALNYTPVTTDRRWSTLQHPIRRCNPTGKYKMPFSNINI